MGFIYNNTIERRTQLKSNKPMKRGLFNLHPNREGPAQKKFKRQVRERDNYTCQFPGCGYYSKHIDVHHIAKRSQRPDLKLTVSNAACLCRAHHQWIDTHHDEAVRLGLLSTESYELSRRTA